MDDSLPWPISAAVLMMQIGGSVSSPQANLHCHRLRILRARWARKIRNQLQNENCCSLGQGQQ